MGRLSEMPAPSAHFNLTEVQWQRVDGSLNSCRGCLRYPRSPQLKMLTPDIPTPALDEGAQD